jgi:GAF domain-containing protein
MTAAPIPEKIPLSAAFNSPALCDPFVDLFPIDGASISMFSLTAQSTICASDVLAARSETLQFELGEGPHWEALRTGLPVIRADLTNDGPPEWPIFRDAARAIGIGAVFAFPMKMGAVTVGVVDMYATRPVNMDPATIASALALAARTAPAAAQQAMYSANDESSAEHDMAPALRREVHQATGMIQAQLDTTATDAFARLRAHSFLTGIAVDDIARDVVARRLDFSTLPD